MTPTSEERKYTPLPWKHDTNNGCKFIKGGKMGKGRQSQYEKLAYTSGSYSEERDKANAELIVTAVNSYYSMRQALQSIAEENYDDDDKKRHLRATIDRMKSRALSLLEESKPLNS